MIISRTPYRLSFFGGGTDYHTWYEKHGGCVLSTSINHYAYITARYLPPFHPKKSRVVWSEIELVDHHEEIHHPAVRAGLHHVGIDGGIEIHHTGDLPARSGLGSSSTFTVGLLNALYTLRGIDVSRDRLANEAIYLERDIMKENVGIQDQIAASYGGLNLVTIQGNGNFSVMPVSSPRIEELQNHLLLFFTGVSRTASNIASETMAAQSRGEKEAELRKMQDLVSDALNVLYSSWDIADFGELLHHSWQIKRSLASNISPQFVDDIYARGRKAGAIGGKLLGAGGGGFILFFARPQDHDAIRAELKDLLWVPFRFENNGSQIIFSDPNSYSRESLTRRDYAHV